MNRVLIPERGDVLLNSTGTGTIGRSCVFSAEGSFVVDGHVTVLRPKHGQTDGRWLNAVLRTPWGQSFLETQCYSGSTNQVELSRTRLAAGWVPCPPFLEQRQIAEILDALDEAIRKTEQIIAKLQQVKQGLLHDLLTRGIDDNGELRDPDRHPEQFKDSPLGRIPKDWDVRRVEQLLAAVSPAMRSGPFGSALLKSELVESGVPLLGIDNVHVEHFVPSYTRFVRPAKAAQLSRYLVRPKDVMITIMGTVGRCCVVPKEVGEAISTKHVWTLTFDSKLYSAPLACLQFNHAPWVLRHFARDEQGGIMSAIRSETLRTTLLPVPPAPEMEEIELRLGTIGHRIQQDGEAVKKLRLLKSGLMEDLLTGRVRVTKLLEQAAE